MFQNFTYPTNETFGQNRPKIFSTQNNLQSVSDDNIDPWKRFLTEKAPLGAFCKKAPKSWRLMNVLFKVELLVVVYYRELSRATGCRLLEFNKI